MEQNNNLMECRSLFINNRMLDAMCRSFKGKDFLMMKDAFPKEALREVRIAEAPFLSNTTGFSNVPFDPTLTEVQTIVVSLNQATMNKVIAYIVFKHRQIINNRFVCPSMSNDIKLHCTLIGDHQKVDIWFRLTCNDSGSSVNNMCLVDFMDLYRDSEEFPVTADYMAQPGGFNDITYI